MLPLLLAALFMLTAPVARADVLVGCVDIYQDIPDCLLYLLDTDRSGAISYTEWVTGVDSLAVGREIADVVDAELIFSLCDYTGDYQLSTADWEHRAWPCVPDRMAVLLTCSLCQKNGWVPGMTRRAAVNK